MKKLLTTTAIIALSTATFAANADNDKNFYVGAALGNSSLSANGSLGSDTSKTLQIGIGYAKDFEIRFGMTDHGEFSRNGEKVEIISRDLDFIYKYSLFDNKGQVFGLAGVGAMKADSSYRYTVMGMPFTDKDSHTSATVQLGGGYRHHFGRLSVQGEFSHTKGFSDLSNVKINSFKLGANVAF